MKHLRLSHTAQQLVLVASGAIGVAVVVVVALAILHQPPVPQAILKQAPYTVLYAKTNENLQVDKSTYKYDSGNKQLSFVAQYRGNRIVISQQPTPDQMTDIPEYYPKFISEIGGYTTFDSNLGRVDLARPAGKGQVAVINAKGALSFFRADHELGTDDWRRLFNNLSTVSPQ
jgi:hypothetical protein